MMRHSKITFYILALCCLLMGVGVQVHAQGRNTKREVEPTTKNLAEVASRIGYPSEASKRKIEGVVLVFMKIDKKGKYMRHRILQDPHPIFTKAVESQIRHLEFTQAISNYKPIECWVKIPFRFALTPNSPIKSDPVSLDSMFCEWSTSYAQNPLKIKELYLHGEGLTSFPTEILTFKNLERLEIGGNMITSLPKEIAQLKRLKILGISGNPITAIPEEILQMPSLQKIHMGGLQLEAELQKSLERDYLEIIFPKTTTGDIGW